jgi:hypothetical protein
MRKETTARLLLSLFTAFIMVAGALGAALPALTQDWVGEESTLPSVVDEAASEQELEMSGTGDAPVSAGTSEIKDTVISLEDLMNTEYAGIPGVAPLPEQDTDELEEDIEEPEEPPIHIEHGSRSPDTVDANGPYGTGIPFAPKYEGDPIMLEAFIEPEDEQENYKFRWDADGDGKFDGPGDAVDDFFGEDGENTLSWTFYDDYQGVALVQAWDGSWTWITDDGNIMDEGDYDSHWWWPGHSSMTWGYEFEVTKDSQIDELGIFRSSSYPYSYYNIRIWDDTPSVIGYINYPSSSRNSWRWHSLSTPVDLYAGNTYTISAYIYSFWGQMPMMDDPGDTEDGIVVLGDVVYGDYNVFPTIVASSAPYPMIDFHYEATYPYPNVLSDTADVLVWNREPTAFGASVTPSSTNEGEMGSEFTGWMVDLGLEDDWEYQWDFGDGQLSGWYPIDTWTGGIRCLLLHTFEYDTHEEVMEWLEEAIGDRWLVRLDHWSLMDTSATANDIPTLDDLLPYDVVIFGVNYAWLIPDLQDELKEETGDVLAEYADAGGGIVQTMYSFSNFAGGAIGGRWVDEGYNTIPCNVPYYFSWQTSDWYDPFHPIITDYDLFSSMESYSTVHERPDNGAYEVVDFRSGDTLCAVFDTDDPNNPGTGRTVGINAYPYAHRCTGDWKELFANSVKWASQSGPKVKLDQPYPLPPISHIYRDDHPEHVTPSDQFQPRVRVRDDDHCNDRILGSPLLYDMNFDSGWGIYGDNPPPGWTIEDKAPPPPTVWDYNDWHRYYFSSGYPGGTGSYAARVYYYPIEDQDEELITPSIDVSGYSSVTLEYDFYYNDRTTARTDYGYVDVRFDGGAWSNVKTYSNSDDSGSESITITVPSGSDTMQVRWKYVAYYEYYWFVDNVKVSSGSTSLLDENFNTGWGTYGNNPPSGWTIYDHGAPRMPWDYNDWHRYYYYNSYPSGTNTNAARAYYYPYEDSNEWLISPVMDLTTGAYSTVNMHYTHYMYNYYGNNDAYVLYREDGGPWMQLDHFDSTGDGRMTYDMSSSLGTQVEFAFNYHSPYGFTGYGYWFVEDFRFEGIPELKHVYGMSPWADSNLISVVNVFPTVTGVENVVDVVSERQTFIIDGLELYDPALWETTEEFWYRWDMDDGFVSPWVYKGAMSTIDILFVHSIPVQGEGGAELGALVNILEAVPGVGTVDTWNIGYYDGYECPTLDYMKEFDIIMWGNNYGFFPAGWDTVREELGDRMADFMDQTGGGVITIFTTYDLSIYYYDIFALLGRYIEDDYGAFEREYYPFSTGNLGTIYDPTHPVMQDVDELTSSLIHSGDYGLTAGATLLADWDDGSSAIGVKEMPNGARSVNIGWAAYTPGLNEPDLSQLLTNAVQWVFPGEIVLPPFDPVEYTYGDNGIYNIDLQVIDDDMLWDWAPGDLEPTFTGAGDPMDMVSHNMIPVEVYNTDPVISRDIRAYAELDLSLRISGTKDCDAYMTLYENGINVGDTSVTRVPGSPNIGVISNVDIEMTKGFEYEVFVEVVGGSGGNPTWIFDMVFPDGKFKEFKHTFNDEHGWTWTITNSMLKGALLGHDIIFEAMADDAGSDDLAFVWNFGDCTPHGVHLYANEDMTTTVEGESDEATVIFDQMENREEWFDKDANDVRTPDVRPMHVEDTISHVFDEDQAYYYYVMLTVMDDDVEDDYPSTELHGTPGVDYCHVELDFR